MNVHFEILVLASVHNDLWHIRLKQSNFTLTQLKCRTYACALHSLEWTLEAHTLLYGSLR